MKNQVILSMLLLFGFTASASETVLTAGSSAQDFSHKTLQVFKAYFDLVIASIDYVNEVTNDRAAMIKLCAIASELLKDGLEFAKKEAKTDAVHEGIYEFEQNILPKLKSIIMFFKMVISNPEMTDEELRAFLKSNFKILLQSIPQLAENVFATEE